MLPVSDTPSLNEWLAIIDGDVREAEQHVLALRARLKRQGIMADPALQISIEDYAQARQLLSVAANTTEATQQIIRRVAIGRAALAPYRNRDEWLALIQADPDFAQAVYSELEGKRGMLGLSTPRGLEQSVAAYQAAKAEQQSQA